MARSFVQLCEEVLEWSQRNFGDQTHENPVLGCLEEIGEIAHAYLKLRQGIRGSDEKHIRDLKDGIGDVTIFLADVCGRVGAHHRFHDYITREPLDEVFALLRERFVRVKDPLWYVRRVVGTWCMLYDNLQTHQNFVPETFVICVDILIVNLMELCCVLGLDFDACVEETWEHVKLRDWIKDSMTGVRESTISASANG